MKSPVHFYRKDVAQPIFNNQKAAAKALNKLVEVMGSDIEPRLLIDRIEAQFQIRRTAAESQFLTDFEI
jgi:hypothetical protein